jgi:uncharacterized protein (TIGR02246 family)
LVVSAIGSFLITLTQKEGIAMKRIIVVLLGLTLLLVFGCQQKVDTEADVEAIKEFHQKMIRAEEERDVETVLGFWDDNGAVMPPDSLAIIGKELINKRVQRMKKWDVEDLSIEIQDIDVSGDLAIIRQNFTATWIPTDGSEVEHESSKEIMTLRRQSDNSWKITNYIWNQNPSVVQMTGQELWDKVISYHDPGGIWENFSGKVHLVTTHNRGGFNEEEIELDKSAKMYRCLRFDGNIVATKGVKAGECFRSINGRTDVSQDEMQKYRMSCDDCKQFNEHHTCHIGLPMELRTSGVDVETDVRIVNFHGTTFYALRFNGGSDAVKHPYYQGKWTLYIDPVSFAMRGAEHEQEDWYSKFTTSG